MQQRVLHFQLVDSSVLSLMIIALRTDDCSHRCSVLLYIHVARLLVLISDVIHKICNLICVILVSGDLSHMHIFWLWNSFKTHSGNFFLLVNFNLRLFT